MPSAFDVALLLTLVPHPGNSRRFCNGNVGSSDGQKKRCAEEACGRCCLICTWPFCLRSNDLLQWLSGVISAFVNARIRLDTAFESFNKTVGR